MNLKLPQMGTLCLPTLHFLQRDRLRSRETASKKRQRLQALDLLSPRRGWEIY